MKIDTSHWKEFNVGQIFECQTTKLLKINAAIEGRFPYITRSMSNNGCSAHFGNEDLLCKGNCITIGAEGKKAFYQREDFIPGVKVYTLRNNHLNVYTGLFLCTILNMKVSVYSYGRARILDKIKSEILKLPVDENNQIDYQYMENYMKSLHSKRISTRIENSSKIDLHEKNWKEFQLKDLFVIIKGKRLTKSDMQEGHINYIGAISENNGVRQHISMDEEHLYQPNCITVNYNGSVGEAFYQNEPFWAGDDVNILYPKEWCLNKYIAMFICTIIKAERYKYGYGRKWTLDKMKSTIIKLPVLKDDTPDFNYMENYIKQLPYSDRI